MNLEEIFKNNVECMVCSNVFEDPRELSCRHTLCFGCCAKIYKDGKLQCPACRSLTREPLDELPVDKKVLGVVECYNKALSNSAGSRSSKDCGVHGCDASATSKAITARLDLCEEHNAEELKLLKSRYESMLSSVDSFVENRSMRREDITAKLKKCREYGKEVEEAGNSLKAAIDRKVLQLKKKIMNNRIKLTRLEEDEDIVIDEMAMKESELRAAMKNKQYVQLNDKLFQLELFMGTAPNETYSAGHLQPPLEELEEGLNILDVLIESWDFDLV